MRIKSVTLFSWYTMLYHFPSRIVMYEAARVGQSTDYTVVSVFGVKLGLYKDVR